ILNEVVPCLEECDTREPSNQQAYFKQTLGNLHSVVCSTPETFFEHALPLWSEVVQCYEGQLSEDYALTVFGALMVSGGVEGVNEDTNLCYLASSVARVLVNNNCNRDVKRVVVSAVEFLYRFAALKLGMHNVPTTDQPGLDGTCEDFSYFVDEGAPLRRLIRENEWQEQISMPFKQLAQQVNGSYVETATQCMQGCLRLHADNLLNDENIFADPCDMHRSLADPSLLEIESRLAEIEDPLAKHKCKLAHKAFVDIATVPLRLAALKLGIDEEGFRCGPY
ncbi:hypothetical protein AAVH_34595, partial [Aphelenchoides avenae]